MPSQLRHGQPALGIADELKPPGRPTRLYKHLYEADSLELGDKHVDNRNI